MAISLVRQQRRVLEGLAQIHRIGVRGASISTLSIDTLQSYISVLIEEYNKARVAWNRLVELEGAARAREIITEDISSGPDDIPALFSALRISVFSLLDAYELNFGAGTINKAFSYSEGSSGELIGGFIEIEAGSAIVLNLNSFCAAIRDACEPLVITE